jgi:uncharacterized oxidoreductase
MKLQGRTALVTGGNTGIGREIALQLSAKGTTVIIVARDEVRAQETLSKAQGRMILIKADLSRRDEQERVVSEVTQRFPDLAILVNNAGIQVTMPDLGVDDGGLMSKFRQEIEVNLAAPIALSFGLLPVLARQSEAAVVSIASGLAIAPKRTAPVYCATKSAIRTFSRALRYRCEDAAPTVNVIDVVMALVDTGMTQGRGRGKLSPKAAARAVVRGIERNRAEVWVGQSGVLGLLQRVAPATAYGLLRNG